MSLTTFKKKSVINYGSKRSGIAPGGVWLPQGPFGHATQALKAIGKRSIFEAESTSGTNAPIFSKLASARLKSKSSE